MDNFCYLCFVLVMLSCLFNVALGSPAGKRLTVPRRYFLVDLLLVIYVL